MKLDDTPPIPIPAKSAVLLIFMPSDRYQRTALNTLINSLHGFLDGSLRILKIEETTHPEVVQSFDISQLPAFVLVRQGIELWRHEGHADEATLSAVSQRLLGS